MDRAGNGGGDTEEEIREGQEGVASFESTAFFYVCDSAIPETGIWAAPFVCETYAKAC